MSPRSYVVAASHGVYHNALHPRRTLETHFVDAIIGYIADLASVCQPDPPREVLAITPIDFVVKILESHKLLAHLPPNYLINVIGAQRGRVLSRDQLLSKLQVSRLSSTGVCHQPRRLQMKGRTDSNRARQAGIEQIASWWHAVRLQAVRVIPYYLTCWHVAEEVNSAMGWAIAIRHSEHFFCDHERFMA